MPSLRIFSSSCLNSLSVRGEIWDWNSGEVFFAEFQAKCLCLFHGQAVVGCISGVEADDILVALNITMLGVLTLALHLPSKLL